jgi:hypothetical protein
MAKGGSGGETAKGGSGGTSSGAAGGTSGSGGDTGTGSTGTCVCPSTCQLPSCLQNLDPSCAPGGSSCIKQTDSATDSVNTCYSNGYKEIIVHDIMTDDRILTAEKGGSTCFTTEYDGNDVFNCVGYLTLKDASGTEVAKMTADCSGTFYIVTCTGGPDVSLDPSCSDMWPVSSLMGSSNGSCTEGTCAP